MKATVISFLFICGLLLIGACVQPITAGVASSTQPAPAGTPAATAPPEPTATPEVVEPTPSPTADETATDQPAADAAENRSVDTALLELGKDVYRRQSCGVCHRLAAVESLGTFGPPHDNLAEIAGERIHEDRYKGPASTPQEYIRESIVDPLAFLVSGYQITRFPMPIFTNLSEQEVDALVYLLMQPPATAP